MGMKKGRKKRRKKRGFDPVAGFPPAVLSLAVLTVGPSMLSWMPVRSRQCREDPGGFSFRSSEQRTVQKL